MDHDSCARLTTDTISPIGPNKAESHKGSHRLTHYLGLASWEAKANKENQKAYLRVDNKVVLSES